MASWTDIGRTTAPMVRQLHDYWSSKRGGAALPDRDLIDPAEIKLLLPNILIAEPSHPPFRVRYRLIGSRIAAASGMDLTGRYLDELVAADDENRWQDHYRQAWSEKIPVYGNAMVPTLHGDEFRYEFGIFPLRKGGDSVGQFIALEDYGGREPKLKQIEDRMTPWRAADKSRR
jgi:hypothetical protein